MADENAVHPSSPAPESARSDMATLQRDPLLARLRPDELASLSEAFDQVAVRPGAELSTEGVLGDYVFFILEGDARMHHGQTGAWTLGAGQHFGELALLQVRSTSTVEAITTMRLARFSRDRYRALSERNPPLAFQLTQALVNSLAAEMDALVDRVGSLLRARSLPRQTEVELTIGDRRIKVGTGTPARRCLQVAPDNLDVVAALHDYKPISLDFPVVADGALSALTLATWDGRDVYRRSVGLALLEAAQRVAPELPIRIGASISAAQVVHLPADVDRAEIGRSLTRVLNKIVGEAINYREELWTVTEAGNHFANAGWHDTAALVYERREPTVSLATLERVVVLATGALLPHTGVIQPFSLAPHPDGLLLDFGAALRPHFLWSKEAATESVDLVADELALPRFGNAMGRDHRRWLDSLGVTGVGSFNERCVSGRVSELIRISEGFHEKRIARIADVISERHEKVRVIVIAGPSSSGKTTFIKRLTVQLEINGIEPLQISLDDYYVDRERTVRDANGEYDFEAFEAIDHQLLSRQIRRLLAGETVQTARFDFLAGKSLPEGGKSLSLSSNSVILVEGIHGLHPRLLEGSVDDAHAFRIFIHPSTTLAFDRLSAVAPSDLRLLRRIVRDRHSRGYRAADNIARWSSVRRGEQLHIYPHLRNADEVFDSSLAYELSVIKVYAERYLLEVPQNDPAFTTALRLRQLLDRFVTIYPDHVPPTSILREFIGGSGFEY